MKQRTTRRPFARPTRRAGSASSAPVFQPLEPRKLLTTLYANPDLSLGQTNIFYGYIAMPAWFGGGMQLNASSVEERSIRVGIRLIDSNPFSTASVTILDLAGHPLFPWIGQRPDGTFSTNVEVSIDAGDDGRWGSDDDETVDVFGLDTGYHPGWRVATDENGEFIPGVWIPDGRFHPVRQLEWLEDEVPPNWDFDNLPENFQLVIPPTGYWHPGEDGIYETADDARLPLGYDFIGAGTDDRIFLTADDAWVAQFASNPWVAPNTQSFEPHLIERVHVGALADDGIADFNNGIGQIIFSNTLRTTRLIFFIVEDFENFEPVRPFAELDADRIGIAMNADGTVYQAPAMGSIIIGNPTRWNWTVHDPINNFMAFQPPGYQRYDRDTEGIRMADPTLNETMGRVYIDGALFGVSRFAGALERVHVGYFGGKLFVDGDFDTFMVAGHAGYFEVNGNPSDTRAALTVGRVLGSFVTGGNQSTFVLVQGDFAPDSILDKPFLRADKVVLEHEVDLFPPGDEEHYNASFASGGAMFVLDAATEDTIGYVRNDTLGTAQYAGRETGYTVVLGTLGGTPGDDQHVFGDGGDDRDVYTIAVDGNSTIRIRLLDNFGNDLPTLIYLTDADGNVLQSRGRGGVDGDIVYTPNTAGIVYIFIENTAGFGGAGTGYQLVISNAAPATLGEIRAGANLTYRVFDGSAITTLVGSIGTIRVGQDSTEEGNSDDAPFLANVLIQSGDSIWNITSGGSIGAFRDNGTWNASGMVITAERHLGQLLAGYGRNIEQDAGGVFVGGSIGAVRVNVRGDIGEIRARALGDPRGELENNLGNIGGVGEGANISTFFTDIAAGGSIGIISVDNAILDDPRPDVGVRIVVGNGQRIDVIEAGAYSVENRDLLATVGQAGVVGAQSLIQTGLGGNVRFFRAPFVWGNGLDNNTLNIGSGQVLTLVDDSGAVFTIRVTGTGAAASIATHAIQGSVGVATVRITAALGASGTLTITNNTGNVEIGDIVVGGGPNARIILNGSGRTDVYYMRVFGGANLIQNSTSGDIVAIDTESVSRVLLKGNLGRTFSSTRVGPHFILGPVYTLGLGTESAVGGPLVYSPNFGSGGDTYLAGGPMDVWLNGLAVRSGAASVALVRIDGSIVDVYSEVTLNRVIANADNQTPFGDFHGVEGSVYSGASIGRIDLGDGLVDTGAGPFVTGLVAAAGVVQRVYIQGEGHNIYGIIMGRGFNLAIDGIGLINATKGASIIGALITTNHLDSFFTNPLDGAADVDGQPTAHINRVIVNGGHIINSTISGVNVNQVNITNGRWDSNRLLSLGRVNTVRADEFIFSYADVAGAANIIVVAENTNRIETTGRRGNIHDLTVDIIGNLNLLAGNTFEGLSIDVDQQIKQIDARARVYRSFFRAGAVTTFNAMEDITRVTFNVAGPVNQFRSRNSSITRIDFTIDGPDGRLNIFEARTNITGDIRISGEAKRIQARDGDIIANIEAFSGDGYIRHIQSGRDMVLTLDVDTHIDRMVVGRNLSGIGNEALKVRGNFGTLDLRNGTFDGTLIVEGLITQTFTIGAVADGSEIVSRGSINAITIGSGINGTIVSYTDGIRRLDINGNFSGSILARDGSLDSLTITGNAAGAIHADEGIRSLSIRAGAGLGGGSGNLTGSITSDTNIDRLDIAGNVAGARITTLFDLRSATIRGSVTGGSIIGAGERIVRLDVDGDVDSSFIIAGLDSLGADNALGGAANNADTFSSGHIDAVNIRGGINNAVFAAGVRSGSDGYATPDADTDLAPGLSNISNVRVDGAASGTNRVIADTTIGNIMVDGIQRTVGDPGANMVLVELDQDPLTLPGGTAFSDGSPVVFTDSDGDVITLSMRGPGSGLYTLSGGANGNLTGLVFNGTTSATSVEIRVTTASGNARVDLNNVNIRFADDADLGNLTIDGDIDGTDGITIDGSVNTITVRSVNTSGTIAVGGSANRIAVNGVTAGSFAVTRLTTFDVLGGSFAGTISSLTIGTVNVRNGTLSGVIWGRDSIGTINNNSTGAVMDRASISTRGEINAINAGTIRNVTLISAGDLIRSVNISGDLNESEIHAGLSLGSDGRYGGTGEAADILSAGTIENVRIQGSFIRSAITAGVTRGVDRFYTTGDDIGSLGFGIVRNVDIKGSTVGSNFNSQSYGITASASVDQVRVNRQNFVQQGNVYRAKVNSTPLPLVVQHVRTRIEADTLYIDIFFNEDVDISTILLDPSNPQAESAIRFENPIDPNGVVPEPNDAYTIFWDKQERVASIRFTRAFSMTNPGVYTLVIKGSDIRSVSGINLDANRDGVTGDDYRQNFLIGDAGDRVEEGTWDPDNDPNTPNSVDFMAATRLDLILDDLVSGNGIKNRQVSFVSRIGDHPDTESFYFPQKFDVDIYSISLDAGDILRVTLSDIVRGSAFVGSVSLRNANGGTVAGQNTLAEGYIERQGGTYYITIAGTRLNPPLPPAGLDELIDISNSDGVFTMPPVVRAINPNEVSNDIGAYELNVMIFSDGDTGFILATPTEITDGQAMTIEGFIGFDSNGVPSELFGDADVYDISRVRLADNTVTTQLEEGMTLTVTLRLSGVGGNLGTRYEVGVFQTTETTGIVDGLLMGAPGPFNEFGFVDNTTDVTFSFQIPQAGTYAIMVQGNIQTNYELIVTIDTGTQGDRRATPYEQNILIEINGGFAEWFGKGGTQLGGFGLASIGFGGFESLILSLMIDEIVQDFADAGITVHVSTDPAEFVGEEFTTVFLTNQVEPGLFGIASTLDPQNQSKADEAIVFVPTFASLFAPGQVNELASALADVVSHEVGHTLGLRHANYPDPFAPPGMMNTNAGPNVNWIFQGDPNDPWGTASVLTDVWFFGLENEVHLLQLIFDVEQV